MSRFADPSLALVLAVAWLGGVALFPRALEPGRADVNGIALNLLVDKGDGKTPNDWFSGTSAVRTELSAGVLRLESHDSGLQILSRPLPVFANECYVVVARGRQTTGTTRLVVTDEELHRSVGVIDLSPSTADAEWRLVFDSGAERRITMVLVGQEGNLLELDRVALIRLGRRAPCV